MKRKTYLPGADKSREVKEQPNILFLMTDHTNAQALEPGSPCLTPNLDAIANKGTRFGRCYTTNAICSPARASLMTSLYPSVHGMWDCTHTQRPEWVDVPADHFTYFSTLLSEAGYHNGYFGKWHVEQSCKLKRFGWHEYDCTTGSVPCQAKPDSSVTVTKDGYRDYLLAGVDTDDGERNHPAFEQGIDFIRRTAGRDIPFCCFISAAEPHDPYIPPERFFEMYNLSEVRLSPTLHDELADKPEIVRRMRSVWNNLTDDDWRRVTAAYWATISFVDSQVGRIIDVLRETGQYDNTIIVFTSDHGDMLGAHGLITKGVGTPYEEVYNIPLIVRAPHMKPGVEDEASVVSLVDLAPTLLDLCGLGAMPSTQGRSLRPVLEGRHNPADWKDGYAEFFGQRFVYTQRIVWHKNWKYVFSPGGIDELYDLAGDPHERHNLANNPDYQNMLREMCKRMWRKMKEIGDTSLFNSQYATLRTAPIGPLSVQCDSGRKQEGSNDA